ncbi:ATP-dependent DNA helicase Q4 isoform X2 [Archocentrus centrarchus]|uniref:ATP-dependent DNA helicase Q4 isoform X2 n=1 Tax=Archocentrus centrarchus TaxID=63155 RepID=UPI0011EA1CEC|nr:ATP-dependent DNA helicase Q4 isoform X2 [Archocentrus centrarchus]
MDRYNEVKLLLKRWEQGFVKEHQRKPNKEDIDRAPEETKNLYKEYRNLKQAKENSTVEAASGHLQAAAQSSTAQKGSDCWGAHLNRSALPASSPKLTSQDRDSLKASSQYYGLKLKNNLVSLSKEKPISLKKMRHPGRVPLNSLKDEQTIPTKSTTSTDASAKNTVTDPESSPFSPRRINPCLGSLASKTLQPLEPEEQFQPFEPVRPANDKPADASSSCSISGNASGSITKGIGSQFTTFTSGASHVRSSTPLSSLSPERTLGASNVDARTTGNKIKGSLGDVKENAETFETPHRGTDSAGSGTLIGFKGSPQFLGGFRGGSGLGGRPSPASRLSFVDRQWLERCQVFGEMGAEEKPGAGNQEIKAEKRGGTEMGGKLEGEMQGGEREGKGELDVEGERKQSLEMGECKTFESIIGDKEVIDSAANSGKGKREGDGKEKRKRQGEMERGQVPIITADDDNESSPETKGTKKRGRKRQREGGDMKGDTTEEGGVKKRRSSGKKKEESTDVSPSSAHGGAEKKKRRKNKGEDDGADEEEKETKAPKKMPQENLLGEIEEEFGVNRIYRTQSARARVTKGAEGNFVKINLKTKSHVKGYALRGVALRKQLYMQKFQLKGERFGGGGGYFGRGRRGGFRGGLSRQGDTCYKCGGAGHWAIDCKGRAPPPPVADDKLPDEEPFELPTLEDVARATGTLRPQPLAVASASKEEQQEQEKEVDSKRRDEVLLNVIRPDYERPAPPPPMEPLYQLTEDGKVQETSEEVYAALRDLGYQSFRPGQEEAIMRILSGLSTLVVLSTGMGKSLCYQLPAYLYAQRSKCITLVISPLVSLMDDQLSGLPAKLKAACIHSNMTMKQREAAIEKVKSGQVCVLLLSPEALVGGGGSGSGCLPSAQELPPVAFACIDEAHCVSEWSHNFRPCYLRLCKALVSLLKGDRFGCLDSIIIYCTRREETVRVAALLRTCLQGVLLKENNRTSSSSQSENNPVGQRKKELARKKIRKPLKWQAESYHAGLSGSERRRVQNNFMCGELRIVVATVAFGMGLDKSDVRGIIHYNMPKSFESYVQEIGRAGRDGELAHCHLFLDPEGGDLHELRRHIYADTVDYYTVKRLVQKVFPACKCKQLHQQQQQLLKDVEDSELLEVMDVCDQESSVKSPAQQDKPEPAAAALESDLSSAELSAKEDRDKREERNEDEMKDQTAEDKGDGWQRDRKMESSDWPRERVCHTHERAIPIQETVEALDITEEGVETLLCYLELHPQRFVELLHHTLSVCKVSCYDGPRQLKKVTKICPPIAVVLARRRMAGERVETCDQLEFDVVEVADTMGWQLPLVKRGLRQLQWSTDRAGGRSGVLVEFSCPSFYFRSYGDLSDEEMDRVCQFLHKRVQDQERTQLYQLTTCFKAFKSVAYRSVFSCVDDLDESRSLQLKSLLSEYFDKRRDGDHTLTSLDPEDLDKYKLLDWEDQIRADIRSFLANRSDEKFSGRAVARIFHGIGSPCYPAQTYGKDRRYWRKYIQFDFNKLIRLATQEIIRFK